MTQKTEFILSARDETKAAFDAVNNSLSRITGSSINLAGSFKNIGQAAIGLAGAGTVAAFTAQIGAAITAMGDLKDAAESTGASVENLSALKGVAKLSGADFNSVTDAINRLSKAMHGTDDESKGAGKALAALGLDARKLRDMDPAEAFVDLARAQDKFADGGGKTAALMAILGKNAASVIPYMKDLAEQQKLVGKVTAEQAIAADEYGKNLVRLQAGWSSLSRQMAAVVVGPAKDVTDWMVEAQKQGGLLNAVLVGIGASMSVAFGKDISRAKAAEDAATSAFNKVASLRKELADAEAGKTQKGWFGESLGLPDQAELRAALDQAERELKSATRRRQKIAKDEAEAGKPKDTSLNQMTFGKEGADTKPKKPAASKETAEATDAAKEYAKAMQALAGTSLDATSAQMALSKTQKIMLDLMQSPTFATMPDTWKATAVAQFEVARATEIAAEEQARLNKLMGETDTGKIDAARKDMELLTKVFEEGRISEEAYLEAVQKRLNGAAEKTKETNDVAKELGLTFSSAFEEAVVGGKKASEVFKSLAMDIAKIMLRKNVTEPMAQAVSGINWGSLFSGLFAANAKGGVYDSPSLSAYSGRVVSSPTMFAFARGAGVMGEAGPEAILPLKRGADGKLGVTSGGNAPVVNINIHNEGAADGYQAQSSVRENNGKLDIEVLFVKAFQNDLRRNGPMAQGIGQTFGMNRSAA